MVDGVDVHEASRGSSADSRCSGGGDQWLSLDLGARRAADRARSRKLGQSDPTQRSTRSAGLRRREGSRDRDGARRRRRRTTARRSTRRRRSTTPRSRRRCAARRRALRERAKLPPLPVDVWIDGDGRRAARRSTWTSACSRAAHRARVAVVADDHDDARPLRLRHAGGRAGAAGERDVRALEARRHGWLGGLGGLTCDRSAGAQDLVGTAPQPDSHGAGRTLGPMEPVTPSIGWGVLHLLLPGRPRGRGARSRSRRSGSSTRSRRSKPTGTRPCAWRCSATKRISGSWHSVPTSPGSRRSRPELLAAPLVPGVLVRLAHRAVRVRRDRRGRARPARVGGGPRRQRARGPAHDVARAHRALPRAAHPPEPAPEAGVLLLPDVEAPRRRRELVRAARSRNARS